jgi:Protein of unknown function (DUF3800)
MRFAYMDEAGNTGRRFDDPDQPIHLILSLVVDEANIPAIHQHVRDAGRRHFPNHCDDPEFEFHGQHLYGQRGYCAGMAPEKRIEIFDDVLSGIELAEADVIVRGVEKPGLARRYGNPYHPHDVALMYTIESIERLARTEECQVLLVADEAKEIEDSARRSLASYQELGTAWGIYKERIDHIVDTIHFVASHQNGAIQVADCATFVAARMRKIEAGTVQDGPASQAIEDLWKRRVEPFIHTDAVWYP